MQKIYNTIRQVGGLNIPFFITGETGVGKKSLAKYIHESGPRRDQPYIVINCDRFSTERLLSELFGHKDGTFTSAICQHWGAFEIANGGVLFLDDVLEMSLDAQKMLLRVLDTATFTRLDSNEALTVDVHIIAAANKDIVKAVAKKEFREDLYYRFKGMMLHIPPLRKRPEDIAPLVEAFINEFGDEYKKNVPGITSKALTGLEGAAWPGNIPQLRSIVQTAVALAITDKLEPKDFLGIYLELAEALISIWHTLPSETQDAIWETLPLETQHTIMHKLSKQTVGPWRNSSVSKIEKKIENRESLNIENMNLKQILRAVAQKRIQQYPTVQGAAKSLNIDVRTLQGYAQYRASDD